MYIRKGSYRMEKIGDALRYSSKMPKGSVIFLYFLFCLFTTLAIGLVIAGIVFIPNDDLNLLSWFCFPSSIAMGWIAYEIYRNIKQNKNYEQEVILSENGMEINVTDFKKNKKLQKHIAFNDIYKILIGNFVEDFHEPSHPSKKERYYINTLLLVIMHKDGNHFHRVYSREELNDWLNYFKKNNLPVYYTDYDLRDAFFDQFMYKIDHDFSQIDGIPLEKMFIDFHFGEIGYFNIFPAWKSEKAETLKNIVKRKKTRKAEMYVTVAIFIYSLLMGLFLLPIVPVENETYIILDAHSIIYELFPIILPLIFVFWRKHYLFFMPLIYYAVSVIGTWIGIGIASLITETPAYYMEIAKFHFNFLYMWYGGYLLTLITKLAMYLHEKFRNVHVYK